MGENTVVVESSESHPGEHCLQALQEVRFYKQDSVCTVILDSSDVTYIPILPVEAGEEVVYYEGVQEEVKVEVDNTTDVYHDTYQNVYSQEEVKSEIDDTTDGCHDTYSEVSSQKDSRSLRPKSRQRISRHGPHKCRVCSKTFSQLVNMVTHERIHTGEKPFKCSVCLKCFSQQPNLWKHMRVHTGERPYQCFTCHKRFTQQANLNKHARIHTGERPYICQHCGRCFTQQANLTKHVRTHTGERPFHCRFCSKSFVQQSNLERHQRTHTGVKPFKCHMCNDCFAQNAHLTKHLRTIHKVTDKSCFVKVTLPCEEMSMKSESKHQPGVAFIDQFPDSPSKKLGIPVLYCTKTGRILKRID